VCGEADDNSVEFSWLCTVCKVGIRPFSIDNGGGGAPLPFSKNEVGVGICLEGSSGLTDSKKRFDKIEKKFI